MKASDIYLKAAERAMACNDSYEFCILRVGGKVNQYGRMSEVFDWPIFADQNQRSLALCFMAAIAKSEGR